MPEEINRMVTDRLSDLLFCPTETAVTNLRKEGVVDSKIMLSGDVMYDAALIFGCDSNCNDSGIWAEPRITSYNVCYTKLLRNIVNITLWRNFTKGVCVSETR